MLDMRDTGRWNAGQVGSRKGGMQERRDAGKEMHDRRDANLVLPWL